MISPGRTEARENAPHRHALAHSHDRTAFWCLALGIGLLQVWAHRHEMNPDGVSYIELAWASVHSGFDALVNGYWSPLYPFLLGVVFRVFSPSVQREFAAVHFFNLWVFLASAAAFEFFLRELIEARQAAAERASKLQPISVETMRICGYVLFLWSGQFWLSTAVVSPDLLVAALVFVATAILLTVLRSGGNRFVFAGLGAALGLGYLAKAAMFPLAFAFLLAAFVLARGAGLARGRAALRTAVAAVIFGLFALPVLIAVSAAKGRPTFGDVGRIAYAETVGGATRSVHWQGEPSGTGTPAHPTRQVFRDPAMYEFHSPIRGSYPPWYDPSYWYEGIRPHFSLRGQLSALLRSANMYLKVFSKSGALWAVLLALVIFRRSLGWGRFAPRAWWAIVPSVAALGLYALVLVEMRYVAPFVLIVLLWMIAKLRVSASAAGHELRRIGFALVLPPALAVAVGVARDAVAAVRNLPDENWTVAEGLRSRGIASGTEVGFMGTGLDAYWAHLAGVRIVAEVPDRERGRFLAAGRERKQEVARKFAEVGAVALVTRDGRLAQSMAGWDAIPGTRYFVLRLGGDGGTSNQ